MESEYAHGIRQLGHVGTYCSCLLKSCDYTVTESMLTDASNTRCSSLHGISSSSSAGRPSSDHQLAHSKERDGLRGLQKHPG